MIWDMWFYEHTGYFWLIISLMFLFAELNTPGLFFFVSFAIGALSAAVMAFMGYSLVVQCFGGLVVGTVSFFIMRTYLKQKKHSQVHYESPLSNIDALIGQRGIVTKSLKPNDKGRAKIGGEEWLAQVDGDLILDKGTLVVVLRVVGNTVVVKPVKQEGIHDHAK